MNIFTWKRREKPKTQYPLGLNAHQLEQLEALKDSKQFGIFISLLKQIAEFNGEVLLSTEDTLFYRRQGYVNALREVINLLPLILSEARRIDNERTRTTNGTEPAESSSFLGSPWRDYRERTRDSQSNA